MKCTDVDSVGTIWKTGDAVWASAYTLNTQKDALALHQEPVRGMFLAGKYPEVHRDQLDKGCFVPRYFAPFRKGSDTEVMWSKVIPVASRDFADTRQESVELYNMRVERAVQWFRRRLDVVQMDLIS